MNPLSLAYGGVTYLRNLLYDTGFFSAQLQGPVVSVGSISAGGAGKTPLVLLLGELLKQRQIPFDVLSRGYGRKSKGVRLVDPQGDPAEFGDEPLLIARRLSVPVVVGENRYHAGLFAEHRFGPQLHLLDDGFQHRALARDYDIALLTGIDFHDQLLPAGRLREPGKSLARADAIAFSECIEVKEQKSGGRFISWPILSPKSRGVWRIRRRLALPIPIPNPIAFCGIARPLNFFAGLTSAGLAVREQLSFPDHHRYSEADIERLQQARKRVGADVFITTEKDLINLGSLATALQPLAIAKVELELENADRVITDMLEAVSARHRARS
jgi:tetraacyldisaccharide 4'-kinase